MVRNTLSVAMVTYNGEDHLREQLASILTQNPLPDELVIGDDGSTDGTVALIRECARDASIPVRLVSTDHVGLRLNVERAIRACTGDVIALADQDDVWMPGKVAAVLEAFDAGDVTVWFSDADLIYESGQLMGERLWHRVNLRPDQLSSTVPGAVLRRLLVGQTVTGATMAFRASLKSVILPFPAELEGDEHLYLHDGWITVLGWLRGRLIADAEPLTRYRRHPRQFTATPEPPLPRPGKEEPVAPDAPAHPASPGSRGLVPLRDLEREHARARLVLDRIRGTGALDECRPADLRTLVEVEELLRIRTLPRGAARVMGILGQTVRGRYSRYARGWRTAAADLLLPRA